MDLDYHLAEEYMGKTPETQSVPQEGVIGTYGLIRCVAAWDAGFCAACHAWG